MLSKFNLTPLEEENAKRYLDKWERNKDIAKEEIVKTMMFKNYIAYLKECTKNGTIRSSQD